MDEEAYDLRVGDSAARLQALGDFEVFVEELKRRRELVVYNCLVLRCENFNEYLSAQAEYKALSDVIDMPDRLAETARDIREHHNV